MHTKSLIYTFVLVSTFLFIAFINTTVAQQRSTSGGAPSGENFRGRVFNDLNQNGTFDEDEEGLAGWSVFVDTNDNGVYDEGTDEITQTWSNTEDYKGYYSFNLCPKKEEAGSSCPGRKIVIQAIKLSDEWEATTDSSYTLTAGDCPNYICENLNFGFYNRNMVDPSETPAPTEGPSPTGTLIPTPHNTQAHSTQSESKDEPEAPICSDTPPQGSPDLFQIDRNGERATLYFTPLGDPLTYYYISYGLDESAEGYGVEIPGDKDGVLSYTINDLDPNKTYYFKVRGGNGCKPGDWSTSISGTVIPAGMPSTGKLQ